MNPKEFEQLEALYNEALNLYGSERAVFLDRACDNDSGLRHELASLLGYGDKAEGYLNTPAMNAVAEAVAAGSSGVMVDRMLDRYQLLSLVGRGGMGEVYCAVDTRLNRLVAVKVLPPYLANDPEWLRRFDQEARAVASLNHPHICTLHDIGSDGGVHYMVFEYLVGELLSDRLARRDLPMPEALRYSMQIGESLVDAHEHGIIHLDLKPQNIMLTRTGVKLFDFGIAALTDSDLSVPGAGTPGYVAPEQREGKNADARADVFSFGAVMRELFTGQSIPELDLLIGSCLANEASERWASVADVVSRLRAIAGEL